MFLIQNFKVYQGNQTGDREKGLLPYLPRERRAGNEEENR